MHQNRKKKKEKRKNIRSIRRENYEANKILRDFDFIFDREKDHYEPKNVLMTLVIIIFNMKVQEIKTKH